MAISKYLKAKPRSRVKNPFSIHTNKIPGRMDSSYRARWSEDTFISDNQERETIGRSFDFSKVSLVFFVLLIMFSILLVRAFFLQVSKGDYYYAMAEGNRIRIKRIEPKRGVIYDRQMKPLVRNQANFLLYFVPVDLLAEKGQEQKILEAVSNILDDLSVEEMRAKLAEVNLDTLEAYRPLFIADNIEYEKALKLYLQAENWPGVVLSNNTRREYLIPEAPDGDKHLSLSHILGYTGKISEKELSEYGDEYLPIDYIGKMGIEYFWENELRGKSGKKQIEVDALGKEKKILGEQPAMDGRNLVLSLDINQQERLEEIVLEHLDKLNLTRASAIILDPNNGEVLAMVSLPAYNNNSFAQGISQKEYSELITREDKPLFNRAVSGEFPSGSTVKPVIAAAALQEGVITENTSFFSTGGVGIGQWYFPDWKAGGHGRTDVRKAIAESVNTFFYYIGGGNDDFVGLGVDRIIRYGSLFGLGEQTGIDVAGEVSGFLPSRDWKEEVKGERWYIGDTYHLAIGQGDLLATPLQVAVFTSVFANGGALYRPHFVKEVLSGTDNLIQTIETAPIREDFIDPYNIEVVRQGMRQTVSSSRGSARSLQVVGVDVAGKTGTAQWSTKNENHAWFTGFAPYKNAELAITVLVEEGGEGSSVAVPIVRDYLIWYFNEYKKEDSEDNEDI